MWPAAIPLFHWLSLHPRLTSLLSIGYVVCSLLATCPSPLLWVDASATITEFNHVHRSRWYSNNHFVDVIFGQMQLSQHLPIHSTCGHGVISPITLLILSPAGCSCLSICRYTAPVGMMTFWWLLWSYQCICQQHLLYSHLQVTLIYYIWSSMECSYIAITLRSTLT